MLWSPSYWLKIKHDPTDYSSWPILEHPINRKQTCWLVGWLVDWFIDWWLYNMMFYLYTWICTCSVIVWLILTVYANFSSISVWRHMQRDWFWRFMLILAVFQCGVTCSVFSVLHLESELLPNVEILVYSKLTKMNEKFELQDHVLDKKMKRNVHVQYFTVYIFFGLDRFHRV